MSHYSRTLHTNSVGHPDRVVPLASDHSLRIAFIHPDLGIGGAERLVVDAAVGLKGLGHHVEIFTSWHDSTRCFEETKDGTVPVHVLGDSIFPRSLAGRFHTLLAIWRQLHLTFSLILAVILSYLPPNPLVLPPSKPFRGSRDWSFRRSIKPFDVFFVDQLSACVPLLRWGLRTRVCFYCHFPDLLLSQGSPTGAPTHGGLLSPAGVVKAVYRLPLNYIEQATTGEADKILVNSEFTAGIFQATFPALRRVPRCVYPGVDPTLYSTTEYTTIPHVLPSDRPTVLSINRLEDKKDLGLAVEAFATLRAKHGSEETVQNARLVLVGGYDPRVVDNVLTLKMLSRVLSNAGLTAHIWDPSLSEPRRSSAGVDVSNVPPSHDKDDVLIVLNAPTSVKLGLLSSPATKVLAYTPSDEHLGIVPLEAMASGIPVLCTNSGGPKETVVDGADSDNPDATGLLLPPIPSVWAGALHSLLTLTPSRRASIAAAARRRVDSRFSLRVFSQELERALRETHDLQGQGLRPDVWLETHLWIGIMVCTAFVAGVAMIAYAFYREPDLLNKIGNLFEVYERHQVEKMRLRIAAKSARAARLAPTAVGGP